MDREFTREIMSAIDQESETFLTPCVNRGNVIPTLRKFTISIGYPDIVSNTIIGTRTGDEFTYTMQIEERREAGRRDMTTNNDDPELPEQKYRLCLKRRDQDGDLLSVVGQRPPTS